MGVPLILSDVPNATPYIQYVATNGQTVFPYPFPITQDADLIVVVNNVALPTDSGYTLSGQGNDTGGNVTFTSGQPTGAIVTLYRDIAIQRLSQIAQNSGFSSTVFNAEFNNLYLIAQQLEASIAQCLQVPNTNNPAPVTTFNPASYANKYLGFDIYGNPQPVSAATVQVPASGSILTAQTVIEAAAGITPTNLTYLPGNVLRYGADPLGLADSATAFGYAAQATSNSANPGNGIGGTGITYAVNATVVVPAGAYILNSMVNTGGIDTTYVFADGAYISSGLTNLNGIMSRNGMKSTRRTYGISDRATGFSMIANTGNDAPAQVDGFTLGASQLGTYASVDSVTTFIQNTGVGPLATIANSGTTYTASTISFTSALSTAVQNQLRAGMIIITSHSPTVWGGFITSWTANSITVSGWYKFDNTGASTPGNGTGALVNSITKIWGQNTVVTLTSAANGPQQATGYELDVLNNISDPGSATASPVFWGMDVVNLGTYNASIGYNCRAGSTGSFYIGYQSYGNGTGFYAFGNAGNFGFQAVSCRQPIAVTGIAGAGTSGILMTGTANGAATVYGIENGFTFGNAVTANAISYFSNPNVAAGTTLTALSHFRTTSASLAGATVTNQIGFYADNFTGATNNIGFWSNMAAASGAFAFYGAGTANSQLGGGLGIYGNVAPAQVTGIGTPTGAGEVANFPGASATLAQCSQTIAGILVRLKAFGLYGA